MAETPIALIVAIGALLFLTLSFVSSLLTLAGIRNALVWVLIFLGTVAVYEQRDVITHALVPQPAQVGDGVIEIRRGRDQHFHLRMQVNGVPVDFMVDTGASQVVLTRDDATRAGIDPATLSFIGTALTANGEVATAPVVLRSLSVGDIHDSRVRATVNGGDMEQSLLGMSYLNRFDSIEIRRDRMMLRR